MQALNNDHELKKKLLTEIKKHEKADAIIKGTYGSTEDGFFRGCAVGCTLKSLNIIKKEDGSTSSHVRYEDIGIPMGVARLEDTIFERLELSESKKWPHYFIEAIPVGVDLSMVAPKFLLWLMEDEEGVIKHAREDGKKSIKTVTKLLKRKLNGDNPKTKEWDEARDVAVEAAQAAVAADPHAADPHVVYAADAHAAATAVYVVDAVAGFSCVNSSEAAADAAEVAADAAEVAADAAEVAENKQSYTKRMADKLLELLRESK